MQDYNYVWYGCMEITLELSCCKYPSASELQKYWEDNQMSLVKFLAEAHRGVQGFVFDSHGSPIEKASLKIKGRNIGFTTTRYGEFWRILLPGSYKLEVYAEGYAPREIDFIVVDDHPTLLNVTLYTAKRNDESHQYSSVPLTQSYHPSYYSSQPVKETGFFSSLSSSVNNIVTNIFG